MKIRNLNISSCSVESHHTFNSNLLLFIQSICSTHSKNITCIKSSVTVSVKVSIYIFNKRMLNKKIKASNFICANCISVDIVNKITKIHCHSVQRLNFISHINITQFYKCAKFSTCKNCIIFCICPDKFRISCIIITRLKFNFTRNSALNKDFSINMNHKFIAITLVSTYIHKF